MGILTLSQDWQPFVDAGVGMSDQPQNQRDGAGYARYAPTAVKTLSDSPGNGTALPAEARHALITINSNPVRMRFDGTAATAANGVLIQTNTLLRIENSREMLKAISFIDTSAGASEVDVAYFV